MDSVSLLLAMSARMNKDSVFKRNMLDTSISTCRTTVRLRYLGLRESLKFARIIFIFYFRTYIFILILVVLNPISTRDLSRMHEIRDWHSF